MASDKKQASAEHQSGGVGAQDQRQQRQLRREVKNQELDQDQDQEFPLMRQTSLYSLTLDEIQNTVCEPGKTFGSMNMDEFLANIWSAEEGPAAPANAADTGIATAGGSHPSLNRQVSLTVPAPLCRKTVDEVWAEIHREQPVHHPYHGGGRTTARQPTFGEMTLEDFLVKAGVVREGNPSCAATPLPPQRSPDAHNLAQQFGLPDFQMGPEAAAGFGHAVGEGYGDHQSLGDGANGVYQGGACYSGGGRMGNGYGTQQLGLVGSPMSPVSSDGLVGMQVESSGPYGGAAEVDGARGGRKRLADGTVEKVVERRQRRMIKNRESAARSRARKQAYTVELEAEINQLREENVQLKEEDQRVKHMFVQTMEEQSRVRAVKAHGTLRRCNSCEW